MKKLYLFLAILFGSLPFPVVNGWGGQGNDEVIVDNSGSTNFSGYRVVIDPSGQVNVMAHGRSSLNSVYQNGQYRIPAETAGKLISDLEAAMPLSGLAGTGCAKSVSFGTSTFVTYKGQTSPDIQCMKSEDLKKDIAVIMEAIPRVQIGVKMP
jgi:hypothetical protein